MSVMWIVPDSNEKALFLEKITDATGIQFKDEGSSMAKITFPDGENITINYDVSSGTIDTSKYRALVDLSKDLFIIYNKVYIGPNIEIAGYLSDMVDFIIAKSNGKIRKMGSSMGYLNVPMYAENDASRNTLTIVPVFEGNSLTYGFYDDIYINYERRFSVGLKFIDQNGNRFVTLGSYLLYKED